VAVPRADTYAETLQLLNAGYNVEEIALTRQLQLSSIYNHIAQLYKNGQLHNINTYIKEAEVEQVRAAVKQTGETKTLTPLYVHMNEELPFEKIRLALAIMEKAGEI
jgi:ATP-dependent DNA helicase RecQ